MFIAFSLFIFLCWFNPSIKLEVVENFEFRFAKIYPQFTKSLVSKAQHLSPSEIKVCMCIKMSFSNIQIQEHMKISESTLANLRSSVRHKIGLNRNESLTNFILCL